MVNVATEHSVILDYTHGVDIRSVLCNRQGYSKTSKICRILYSLADAKIKSVRNFARLAYEFISIVTRVGQWIMWRVFPCRYCDWPACRGPKWLASTRQPWPVYNTTYICIVARVTATAGSSRCWCMWNDTKIWYNWNDTNLIVNRSEWASTGEEVGLMSWRQNAYF